MIKLLSKDYIDDIISLESDFPDAFSKESMLSSFNSGRFFALGYFEEEKLLGILTYSLSIDDADIDTVYVRTDKRNKGIASLLLCETLNQIKSKNINKVFLEVREGNLPAISLYEKFSFHKIDIRRKYYFDGENAIIMQTEI